MSSTQPARGTRDFLPAEVRRREYVIDVVRHVYERYGFEPLETPAFENIETLTGKYGEEGSKLIFKILRRGEHEASGQADLALRYDLTVPLSRVVAEYQSQLPRYFRRYQIQPVWRADRPARGRFREFYQCDIDAMGSTSPVVEAEVIAAVSEVLTTLGFNDFHVRLNDRALLGALLATAGVDASKESDALVAIDKLDKIGAEGVAAEFVARGLGADTANACLRLFVRPPDDSTAGMIRHLEAMLGDRKDAVHGIASICALSEATPAAGRIRIDPSLARGLSYYTGAIMEIAVPDLAGSLGGGGRYDNLIGMFLGRDVPACGFSLGLERIIVVMTERGMFPASVGLAPADVMVALWDDASRADALRLAFDLRKSGLRVDVYPEPGKVGRQFKYADSRGYRAVLIQGEDERRDGTVNVKDLQKSEQRAVPRGEVVEYVARIVRGQTRDGVEG